MEPPSASARTLASLLALLLTSRVAALEVGGKVGGAVELECLPPSSDPAVTVATLHVVEWVRRGLEIPVLISFGSYPPHVHPNYAGRVSLVRLTALRLKVLQLEDQGLYECRILLLEEPADELRNGTWTRLSVTGPPTFTEAPPPAVEVLVGGRLSLTCGAKGNPRPSITWLKDGAVLQRTDGQDAVVSLVAAAAAAGRYTCYAANSEGNVTAETKVEIKGPPVIVVAPKDVAVNVTLDALLRCRAAANPPNMTYIWQKAGENVHHIQSLKSRVKIMVDGTLLISAVTPQDSGTYTCTPTNGLLTPPTAAANLTVMHPALVLDLPPETYLPAGRQGRISCPTAAQPPLLHVDWTRDGEPLDLSRFPGWSVEADGSLQMQTVNEDARGTFTCTPFNSYGTMGSSSSTNVLLQDPPAFAAAPEKEYRQEVGRTLAVPCRGNQGAATKVTWRKAAAARNASFSVRPDGSLLLRPLLKDHQGAWECRVENRVAAAAAVTHVYVLGTSPHAATSLSVTPEAGRVRLSWAAGFDGGSPQTFSVWLKKISGPGGAEAEGWSSRPVPPGGGTRLDLEGLGPDAEYQFSVLSRNRVGAGPFSRIATARTLDPARLRPAPPPSLSADRRSSGVVLSWNPPAGERRPPVDGFVLQFRRTGSDWTDLDAAIGANSTETLVRGLEEDSVYELRLLSRRGELLSEPGPSVNVSTVGLDALRSPSRGASSSAEPLLAGVLGGVGFMFSALVLLLGSAWLVGRRRRRRRREKDDLPPAIFKCPPSMATPGSASPDSLLKKSFLPGSSSPSSSSASSDWSSPVGRRPLRPPSPPPSPSMELISRGPDGRFLVPPSPPFVLSVDLPPPAENRRSPVPFAGILGGAAALPRPCGEAPPTFPVLPHIRLSRPATSASALVLQMEHEREAGNLSRCLALAREREELELRLMSLAEPHGQWRDGGGGEDVLWGEASPWRTLSQNKNLTSSPAGWRRFPSEEASASCEDGWRPPSGCDVSPPCSRQDLRPDDAWRRAGVHHGDGPEMSVDEPGSEVPMLHRRIAAHLRRGLASPGADGRRSRSLRGRRPSGGVWDWKGRSQSLDARAPRRSGFLTPDDWIHSLSRGSRTSSGSSPLPAAALRPLLPVSAAPNPEVQPGEPSDLLPPPHAATDVFLEETDLEAGSYQGVPECGSGHSSYASSGRGSMEAGAGRPDPRTASGHLAVSPPTGNRGNPRERCQDHMEPEQRRKASVDESYEWDSDDLHLHHPGPFPPATRQQPLPLLQGHQREQEPGAVLF